MGAEAFSGGKGPAVVLEAPLIASPGVDLEHPSPARVYDALLDGSTNWAIDREFAHRVLQDFPEFKEMVRANRMLGNRVVRHLARQDVRQFIDIGSGILSGGNTHQVADKIDRDSRVVYVESEPVAVAHAEVLLDEEGDPDRHAIVNVDFRLPGELWDEVLATGIINPREPVAVLMFAVLYLLRPGPESTRVMDRYRTLLPGGSYLAISHITDDGIPTGLGPKLLELKRLGRKCCNIDVFYRSRRAIETLLGDFEVIPPGMVWAPQWCPDEAECPSRAARFDSPNQAAVWTGVGRKRV